MNLYSYCNNNPIISMDINGSFGKRIIKGVKKLGKILWKSRNGIVLDNIGVENTMVSSSTEIQKVDFKVVNYNSNISTSITSKSNNAITTAKLITLTVEQNPKDIKETTIGVKSNGLLNLKLGLTNTGIYVNNLPITNNLSTSNGIRLNLLKDSYNRN